MELTEVKNDKGSYLGLARRLEVGMLGGIRTKTIVKTVKIKMV